MKIIKLLIFILLMFISNNCFAEEESIIFGEVAWMGTVNSGNDEWIELYNQSDMDIDINGWRIESKDGAPLIELEGTISANGFYILERSDDDANLNIIANLIYTGALGNSGEELQLFDEQNNLIDFIDVDDGWPAGNNETKQTMERVSNGEIFVWQDSENENGSPGFINNYNETTEVKVEIEEVQGNSNVNEKNQDDEEEKVVFNYKIMISEIFPDPKWADEENEYFELYNYGNTDIDLYGWEIQNLKGDNFKILHKNKLIIKSGEKRVIYYKESNILLNNFNDHLKLFAPDGRIISEVEYSEVKCGYGYEICRLNFNGEYEYCWKENITPGKLGEILPANHKPEAVFSLNTEIKSGKTVIFDSSDSFDLDGDNLSFAWDFGDGFNNILPSPEHLYQKPGEYNVKLTVSDGIDKSELEKIIIVDGELVVQKEEKKEVKIENSNVLGINETKIVENNTSVKIVAKNKDQNLSYLQGYVVVPPGIFGTQYFYIQFLNEDENTFSGVQGYSYKKDFPKLVVGDEIIISGEMSEYKGEKRIKTQTNLDIRVMSNNNKIYSRELNDELTENDLSIFVQIEGELVKKDSTSMIIWSDYGEFEIRIKKNTNINTRDLAKGAKLKIQGIVSKVSDRIVILPRSMKDIEKVENEEQVLGESDVNEQIYIQARNKNSEFLIYLLIISSILIIGLTIWIIQLKKNF